MKYLDYNGLSYFFQKMKTLINNRLGKVQEHIITTSTIADNSTITSPIKYEVGNDSLEVYLMGEKLVKADPDHGVDGHYLEVGTKGSVSTQIKLYNIGQSIPKGIVIEFVVDGNYNT